MVLIVYCVKAKKPTLHNWGVTFDDYKRAEEYWLDEGKPGLIWSMAFTPVLTSITLERDD